MQMRKLTRSRLVKVRLEAGLAPAGTEVTFGGKTAGRLGATLNGEGLALLRLDMLEEAQASGQPFAAGQAQLRPL